MLDPGGASTRRSATPRARPRRAPAASASDGWGDPVAEQDSNFGSDDTPASAYAGAAGAVTAGAAVARRNSAGHSAELDYTGPELAHSAELDYQGADDDLPNLPREAAQAPAREGRRRPGDLRLGAAWYMGSGNLPKCATSTVAAVSPS